jgi:heme-degrading monooxygenase HmoA
MTVGTIDFLLKLDEKYSDLHFKIMENREGGLAYYEHSTEDVFESGRKFEIIEETGEMQDTGHVVMNNIPVSEEGRPVFEERFKDRKHAVEDMPGFYAFRLLRPIRGEKYVVLTQWASTKDFENWKESDVFSEAHKKEAEKPSSYLFQNAYIAAYNMYVEEEEVDEEMESDR